MKTITYRYSVLQYLTVSDTLNLREKLHLSRHRRLSSSLSILSMANSTPETTGKKLQRTSKPSQVARATSSPDSVARALSFLYKSNCSLSTIEEAVERFQQVSPSSLCGSFVGSFTVADHMVLKSYLLPLFLFVPQTHKHHIHALYWHVFYYGAGLNRHLLHTLG